MQSISRCVAALATLTLAGLAGNLSAAVFVVPSDAELIRASDAVVVATVRSTAGRLDPLDGLDTDVRIDVEEVLKGTLLRGPMTLVEQGGTLGMRARFNSAATNYFPTERALIFLTHDHQNAWTTYGMTLGKFTYITSADGTSLMMRGVTSEEVSGWDVDGHPFRERPRQVERFIQYVRDIVAGHISRADYFVDLPERSAQLRLQTIDNGSPLPGMSVFSDSAAAGSPAIASLARSIQANVYPASAYLNGNIRWFVFDAGGSVTFRINGTQPPYDTVGAAQRGLAAWTNDPGSNVDYRYGGTTTAGFVEDGANTIVYNASSGVPAGAIAYSQWFANGQSVYKGETLWTTSEGDVIVKAGISVSQTTFDEAVMHELGHTLGFRHSEAGTPSSTTAIMYSVVSGRYGAVPQQWDRDALAAVYGSTGPTQHFNDVPPSHPFFSYIENIYGRGITGGCAAGYYCPDSPVSRDQMAVFLERAKNGGAYVPPAATGRVFADVSTSTQFAAFIEKLYADGISGGCASNPLRYCPSAAVTRRTMAVFLLRAKYGASYQPPAATGVFSDVPANSQFAAFVEQLYREGTTGGCAANPLRYCPESSVTRGEMAAFLVRNFGF